MAVPPRYAPGNRKMQIVWPRDKKQKGAHTWGRFRDVLSGKGPDMWINRKGDIGPTRPEWSRWDIGSPLGWWDNLGYWDSRYEQIPPWLLGQATGQKRYDFYTRKYETPHMDTWTDVKWNRNGKYPLYVRDAGGFHYVDPLQQMEPNVNPFEHDPSTNWWNWHSDRLPVDFPPIFTNLEQ